MTKAKEKFQEAFTAFLNSKQEAKDFKDLFSSYTEFQTSNEYSDEAFDEALETLMHNIIHAGEYDPNFGDDRECECGHTYYRHFDSWDDMYPCGCKYCGCSEFKEKQPV